MSGMGVDGDGEAVGCGYKIGGEMAGCGFSLSTVSSLYGEVRSHRPYSMQNLKLGVGLAFECLNIGRGPSRCAQLCLPNERSLRGSCGIQFRCTRCLGFSLDHQG